MASFLCQTLFHPSSPDIILICYGHRQWGRGNIPCSCGFWNSIWGSFFSSTRYQQNLHNKLVIVLCIFHPSDRFLLFSEIWWLRFQRRSRLKEMGGIHFLVILTVSGRWWKPCEGDSCRETPTKKASFFSPSTKWRFSSLLAIVLQHLRKARKKREIFQVLVN